MWHAAAQVEDTGQQRRLRGDEIAHRRQHLKELRTRAAHRTQRAIQPNGTDKVDHALDILPLVPAGENDTERDELLPPGVTRGVKGKRESRAPVAKVANRAELERVAGHPVPAGGESR